MKKILKPTISASLLLALIFTVGTGYLIQTNVTATKGYKIKELQSRLDELQQESKKLNLSYIELQSISNITAKSGALNLVPVAKLEIITPVGSAMALR